MGELGYYNVASLSLLASKKDTICVVRIYLFFNLASKQIEQFYQIRYIAILDTVTHIMQLQHPEFFSEVTRQLTH